MIIGSRGTRLDTPGDLVPGRWHHVRLTWNCRTGQAVLKLDGTEIAVMEQYVRTRGVCYLRIRSTAPGADPAGLYIRSVGVKVRR